jgi:hypothetical protein
VSVMNKTLHRLPLRAVLKYTLGFKVREAQECKGSFSQFALKPWPLFVSIRADDEIAPPTDI